MKSGSVQVSPATLSTIEICEPTIAPVEPSPYMAPSSDGSISDQSNPATTNGNSRHPPSMDTGALSVTSNTSVNQQTISRTSTVLSLEDNPFAQHVQETYYMVFGPNSSAGSQH
ncbi:hypothetical protein K503DRAFT_119634 [Rhizopogon vinicolor AM-OR11-026]|uniref:Uncharacterized protein n=1 Tax=Rhizopogon vinicolor AM-OR11-026 TaxID=1314800 RepID=A0A1B7MET5_9AGAM|nr:hypothetical protein K503DRAFT_119634 [Rhizopogon vinicolor AM-OR11-026]